MKDAIALLGSSRRHGNTGQLVDDIATRLDIEIVDLGQKCISPYDYEHRNRSDDFEPLMTRVLDFNHIIICSPVYWYSVSPQVKIFLDRITDYLDIPELLDDGRRLRGKTGHIVCTSIYDSAPSSFLATLTATFSYLGMHTGGVLHANCSAGYSNSNHGTEIAAFARRFRHQ